MENTGERQVSPTLDGIRRDHVARYEFAAEKLRGKSIIDCACGIGYGAKIMADGGAMNVKAVDISAEAIDYAKEHYSHKNVRHVVADARCVGPFSMYDAIVSFETIEHIEDPLPVLRRFGRCATHMICSVPNEDVLPHRGMIKYHYRHYTPEQFEALLNRAGWEIIEWHGQAGPESEVEPNLPGRTLIAVCSLSDNPQGGTWKKLPKLQSAPESVAIVAMGRSSATYLTLASHYGDRRKVADETWAINSMGGVIQHDLLFHMDDCKVQESRVDNDNVSGMLGWLKTHPGFMTSKAYPDYPGAIEFPLQDVINSIRTQYFNSTVAYAVAYAMHIGVKKISLYGADFSYPNGHKAESGRGCVEFLLGIAAARGIYIEVAADSTLLDSNVDDDKRFYGYDAEIITVESGENGAIVKKTPRDNLPSAEEIEQRYNHEPKF